MPDHETLATAAQNYPAQRPPLLLQQNHEMQSKRLGGAGAQSYRWGPTPRLTLPTHLAPKHSQPETAFTLSMHQPAGGRHKKITQPVGSATWA